MTEPNDALIPAHLGDARQIRPLGQGPGWPLERAAGWLRRRRRRIRSTIFGTTAALLLMAGSVLAWRLYAEWRLGRIELTTDGAPVVAQVLAETSDDPIGEPFDLVTRAIVSLPAGEYRLRVNGMGRLGRTYRFTVNRGETQTHTISIDEGRLAMGRPAPRSGFDDNPAQLPTAHGSRDRGA